MNYIEDKLIPKRRRHSKSLSNMFSGEAEYIDEQMKNAFSCGLVVIQNYLGQPAAPFSATPQQLQQYLMYLFNDIEPEMRDHLQKKCQNVQYSERFEIQLKLQMKDVFLSVSAKYADFTYVFCRIWVNAKDIKCTKAYDRNGTTSWNEDFLLNIENYQEDTITIEIWISKSPDIEFAMEKKVKSSWPTWKQLKMGRLVAFSEDIVYLVGSASEAVKNLPSVISDLNLVLTQHSSSIGSDSSTNITVTVELCAQRNYFHDYHFHLHMVMLKFCYEKQLSTLQYSCLWKNWLEMLPVPALTLLHQHAIQRNITLSEQTLCSWIVSSALKVNFEKRISYMLLSALLENLKSYCIQEPLQDHLLEAYLKSRKKFLEFAASQLADMHENFDWSIDEKVTEFHEFLRCIILGEIDNKVVNLDKMKQALQENCQKWCFTVIQDISRDLEDTNPNEVVADAIKSVIKQYLVNQIYLDDIFERAWDINYSELTLKYLNSSIESVIKPAISHLVKRVERGTIKIKKANDVELLKMLQIFHTFRNLVEYLESRLPDMNSPLLMANYPSWFGEKMILQWFILSTKQAAPFIKKAVECDEMEPINGLIKHGTSAPDVVNIIDEMVLVMWLKMQWEDQFVTHSALVDAISGCAVAYVEAITSRMQHANFFYGHADFVVTPKLCVALNNIHALCDHLRVIGHKITKVIHSAEETYSFAVVDQTMLVVEKLVISVSEVFHVVLKKIKEQLQALCSDVVTSHETKLHQKALRRLCLYTEETLEVLYCSLTPAPFNTMLRAMWVILLEVLYGKTKKSKYFFSKQWSKSSISAIAPALNVLQNVFYCKGHGLSYYEMQNKKYLELKELIKKSAETQDQ